MQKIILILLLAVVLYADNINTPAEKYCSEYKAEALKYESKSYKGYLAERYDELAKIFYEKYEKCLEEYESGKEYEGYKKR